MEIITAFITLVFTGCLTCLAVIFHRMGAIDQDRYNLYGDVSAKNTDIELGQFIGVSSCRHNKSHFTPCSSCGFWHPYKYVRHLYLKRQFNTEWDKDRLQRIKEHADERQRV